jgi:glycosyltransferase involved in cell wall biosynthesis
MNASNEGNRDGGDADAAESDAQRAAPSLSAPNNSRRLVFVARRFPPSVGGMQTFAADVCRSLQAQWKVQVIALRAQSVKHVIWFLPWALLRTAAALARRDVQLVVCGDAITWMAVSAVVRLARAPSSVMVMGLDLTFSNRLYQTLLRYSLPRADRVVAISRATAAAAVDLGVDRSRVSVMHPGIEIPAVAASDRVRARSELIERFSLAPDSFILIALGRLVRRKGVSWFIESVLPRLPARTVLLVAGEGPMRNDIETAADRVEAQGQVRILGRVDDAVREQLLTGCDIAIMPNVPVDGDMEGFGLVAVEAAVHGAIVVAAMLEGLADAVSDGETGFLLKPEDADGFTACISRLAASPEELLRLSHEFRANAARLHSIDRMAVELPVALGLTPAG